MLLNTRSHTRGSVTYRCTSKARWECLFDTGNPYISSWLWLHNIDTPAQDSNLTWDPADLYITPRVWILRSCRVPDCQVKYPGLTTTGFHHTRLYVKILQQMSSPSFDLRSSTLRMQMRRCKAGPLYISRRSVGGLTLRISGC
jgi:hypothetical protein